MICRGLQESRWPGLAYIGPSCTACRTDAELKGARLGLDVAANSSPPPCGEGSGVGVGRCGTSVPHGTTPHPIPPPAETAYTRVSATRQSDRNRQQPISIGGRESSRLPFVNLAPMPYPL